MEWLDKMHNIADQLDGMGNYCRGKSVSLYDLDMRRFATEMETLAQSLEYEANHLRVLIGEKLTEQAKDAGANSATVFKAVLAGMKIGEKDGE